MIAVSNGVVQPYTVVIHSSHDKAALRAELAADWFLHQGGSTVHRVVRLCAPRFGARRQDLHRKFISQQVHVDWEEHVSEHCIANSTSSKSACRVSTRPGLGARKTNRAHKSNVAIIIRKVNQNRAGSFCKQSSPEMPSGLRA